MKYETRECGHKQPVNRLKCSGCEAKQRYWSDPAYREKCIAKSRANAKKDPYRSEKRRLRWHRMTEEERDSLFESQGGKCALCGTDFSERNRPRLDHDHDTNRVRGMVCHKCNLGLHYIENGDWAVKAIDYLEAASV